MNDKHEALSRLVDGELSIEAANELLREVLTDPELQKSLDEQLRLRALLASWRTQRPKAASLHAALVTAARPAPHPGQARRYGELVAVAILAGVLVFSGFWVAQKQHDSREIAQAGPVEASPSRSWFITPEKQKEVADVFAFHESVAGPLTWLADGESKITVNEASRGSSVLSSPDQQPIAVLLRLKKVPDKLTANLTATATLTPEQTPIVHEYIVVCRPGSAATIDLPDGETSLKLQLLAERGSDHNIEIKYALAAAATKDRIPGTLSGEQVLGLESSSLGQLVMDRQLYSVEAGAWQFEKM